MAHQGTVLARNCALLSKRVGYIVTAQPYISQVRVLSSPHVMLVAASRVRGVDCAALSVALRCSLTVALSDIP
jgi:hypothetical protein